MPRQNPIVTAFADAMATAIVYPEACREAADLILAPGFMGEYEPAEQAAVNAFATMLRRRAVRIRAA